MSEEYYNELWLVARNDVEKLLKLDRTNQRTPKTSNKEAGLNVFFPTYLRYRNLVKRLIVCHDQLVQTQKRELIKRVLDCAIGRMLEYKQEIINLTYTDNHWPDEALNQLKYIPGDVEITVSAMGKDLVEKRQKMFEKMIEEAHAWVEPVEEPPEEEEAVEEEESPKLRRRKAKQREASETPMLPQESPEEIAAREARLAAEEYLRKSVLLIQSHERARIGRCMGGDIQRTSNYVKKVECGRIIPKRISRKVYDKAARVIQRAWKRFKAKKEMRKRIARVEDLMGMTTPSWKADDILTKDRTNFQNKLQIMPAFAERIAKKTDEEQARLLKVMGPGLIEDISDEIREWFIVWYNERGHFGAYPAADLGGSVLIATGETVSPEEILSGKAAKEAEQKNKKAKKRRTPWIPSSTAFHLLDDANKDFIQNWSVRDDLKETKIFMDMIKERLCYELQLEMREIVDQLMRLELQKLNRALKRDCARDDREFILLKEKSAKRKRPKQKKNTVDDIPMEVLFRELTRANIIRHYPIASLDDWIGDRSYQNYEAMKEFRPYKHRMGDIKQAVIENCVLPLSSKEVHEVAPLVRSVCICGLPRHGKTFLVNAICSAVGALMFDMSPAVMVDQFVGKKDERRLFDMIAKVAREYAPSVIFIDGGEKPWAKKLTPVDRYYKPKRLAKYYPKFVKGIQNGDQILFLTTSAEPYNARRPFVKLHKKFIFIPLTDYNTLYMFYKDLLTKYHGVDRNVDVSGLAKISVGIPLEVVKNAVENVLNVRRRITLKFNPLNTKEIAEELLKYEPPNRKVLTKYEKFESRTPMGRKRKRMLAEELAEHQRALKEKQAMKGK